MRFLACLAALLLIPASIATLHGADKKKPTTSDIKRQQQDVQKAKDKLKDEQQDLSQAKTAATRADAALDRATQAVAALRRQIQNEQLNAGPLVATRKQFDELKQKMEEVAKPVREQLRSNPNYRDAIALRDRLQQQLDNPAGSGSGAIVAAERLAKELVAATGNVRQLENEALAKVPEYQSLDAEKRRLENELQNMAKQRETQLANDPRLRKAQEELTKAKQEAAEAEKKLRRELQQQSAAQQKVRQEESEKRAIEQRKRDADRKPKSPKKK